MDDEFFNVPLNPLRAFAIASRHKTFTAAADFMGISQVAISRQIRILEGYLGIQLFVRGARSVKLTEEGRNFGQEIAPLFDSIEASTKRLLMRERLTALDLRIYPTLAHYWLLPHLNQFYEDYPEYTIRLDTTVAPLDFRGTHLDVAIQLGDGMWKDSKARLLFPERIDLVCSPEYEESTGGLKQLSDLEKAAVLHAKYRKRAWKDWMDETGEVVEPKMSLEFETSLLSYSAAINGLGVTVGQIDILGKALERGDLKSVFSKPIETGAGIYIVWPTTKSVSTQTKRFVDWILKINGQQPEFFKRQ